MHKGLFQVSLLNFCKFIGPLALCLLAAAPLKAADFVLYDSNGSAHPKYDEITDRLGPGDTITFSNGKSFTIKRFLGQGNTAKIFETSEGIALRIAKSRHAQILGRNHQEWLTDYLRAAQFLKSKGLPVPIVYHDNSLPGEYVSVELLKIDFNLADYAKIRSQLDNETRAMIDTRFEEFAAQTWAFIDVGDMFNEQIVFSDGKWIFLDFSTDSLLASDLTDGNIFEVGYKQTRLSMMAVADRNMHLSLDRIPVPGGRRMQERISSAQKSRIENGLKSPVSCWSLLKKAISDIFTPETQPDTATP